MASIDLAPDYSPTIPLDDSPTVTGTIIDHCETRAQLTAHFFETRCRVKITSREHAGIAGLRAAQTNRPDLIFVCLNFTDISPTEFIHKVGAVAPQAKLILFLDRCSEYVVHLIDAFGYSGLICFRETDLNDLVHIIAGIQNGIRFISPKIVACQNRLRCAPNAFPKLLTKKQIVVLVCISHSLSDEEIAARLDCSAGTILCHRRQIMNKLDIHSTPKLIRYGIEKGFDAGPLPLWPAVQRVSVRQIALPISVE